MAIVWKWGLNWNANALVWPNGTASNVTWVDWKSNWAGSFNGSNSFINMWNTLDENWDNPFSLICFIKTTSSNNQMIMWKQLGSWSFAWYMFWFSSSDNKIRFDCINNWASNGLAVIWDWTIADWNYKRIGVTYDWSKSASWVKIYINWVAVITNTILNSLTGSVSNSANFNIGSRNNWNLPVNWLVDECIKWNTALTPAEVKNDYLFYNWFI